MHHRFERSDQAARRMLNLDPAIRVLMDRFVEGLGLTPTPEHFDMEGKMITEGGYAAMLEAFGIK